MARSTAGSVKGKRRVVSVARFDGASRVPTGCRFILDDDGVGCLGPRWRYCQQPTAPGQSFCAEHRARAYIPGSAAVRSSGS
ncbi:MAG: hypothetical protein E6Q97_03570 [Desulfurellales bacterium]|nr:MAG: hypothetical protein E6Q97_03570 [Desulfurellales bacterium]